MKFLADENIEKSLVEWLRSQGSDVYYVPEESPSIKDSKIIKIARKESRVLITNDKDFGELVFRQKKLTHGIVLIRATDESSENKLELLKNVLDKVGDKVKNKFVVVNESGIRVRET